MRDRDRVPMLLTGLGFLYISYHATFEDANPLVAIGCGVAGFAWVVCSLSQRFGPC